ncbi:MAG: iron(III) ABC transporter permease [Dehalococcoidia bacterium]|nr:MAG: iron(III) ABC transporter permease [Dehalococcoidia bacterium]
MVLHSLTLPADPLWIELSAIVLPTYLANTVLLVVGVGLSALVLGVTTAWLVTMCHLPGRRVLDWLLVLPLAFPTYLLAYASTDLFEYAGPVQSTLRRWFGAAAPGIEFRSLPGAIAVLTIALYPYVYLFARAGFLRGSATLLQVSRALGCGPWRSFFTVALPLARPAIVAGLALVLMETLAEFGAVQYFAVDTFTTGIYLTWFALGSPAGAMQLAAFLLAGVGGLLALERVARGGGRVADAGGGPLPRYPLGRLATAGALTICLLPVVLGFILPLGVFGRLAVEAGDARLGVDYLPLLRNSVVLGATAAGLIVLAAIALGYAMRIAKSRFVAALVRFSALGYAVPGSVLSVGVLAVIGAFDRGANALGLAAGLVAGGSIGALLYAYGVRFLAIALNAVESGLATVRPEFDAAARTLGIGPLRQMARIHLPLLRASLLTGALLVFVDVLKELPATLIVRPFNFDTLAVRAYQLASDERLSEAATPALTIVAAGLVPVIMTSLALGGRRR